MADQPSSLQKNWVVAADQGGVRLDVFLRQILSHWSRQEAEIALREKLFWVNGGPAKKGNRLAAGDSVCFIGPEHLLSEGPLPNPQLSVPIVYEDSQVLVIDKPAGMDTHGFSARHTRTLVNFIAAQRPEVLNIGTSRWEPGLIHRLDRETSGLLVVAKTQEAFDHLRLQFRRRSVHKGYRALAWGVTELAGVISYPLAHDPRDKRRMQALTGSTRLKGKRKIWHAVTRFKRIASARGLSLVEITMETGVTHQIRAHLAAIGHPIVGDSLYGVQHPERFRLHRHFLHAVELKFIHPQNGTLLELSAEWPPELRALLLDLKLDF